MSPLTFLRMMMPWDWNGIVMIRSDTRRRTSTNGTISRPPPTLFLDGEFDGRQVAHIVLGEADPNAVTAVTRIDDSADRDGRPRSVPGAALLEIADGRKPAGRPPPLRFAGVR